MTRALHICLLLLALLGLLGQSTAMAMAMEAVPQSTGILQASMADMDCTDMANKPVPGKSPCKTMTMHCIAAMGGASLALVEQPNLVTLPIAADPVIAALPLAARLWGRSYGPEPDPPSFLI